MPRDLGSRRHSLAERSLDAKLDGQPVLAITGLQYHDLIGTLTQQDVELDKLFEDVCVYNYRIMSPAHVENVVEPPAVPRCRAAASRRSPWPSTLSRCR